MEMRRGREGGIQAPPRPPAGLRFLGRGKQGGTPSPPASPLRLWGLGDLAGGLHLGFAVCFPLSVRDCTPLS